MPTLQMLGLAESRRLFAALVYLAIVPTAARADPLADLQALSKQVQTLIEAERFGEAETPAQRMVAIIEQQLTDQRPMLIDAVQVLGKIFFLQKKYDEAANQFQRSLTLLEATRGRDSLEAARELHTLGNCRWNQGRYADAAPLYARALAIRQKRLEANHDDADFSRRELAAAYDKLGQFHQSQPLYHESLSAAEARHGAKAPQVATRLHALADCHWRQGRYASAAPLYERAWRIRASALGEADPQTLFSRFELARAYGSLRRFAEAETIHLDVLAMRERTLGAKDLQVAGALVELGRLYREWNRPADAVACYQRAAKIREQALGPEHVDVAATLASLGWTYNEQGNQQQAEASFRRALAIRERLLPADSLVLADSLESLGQTLEQLARYSEAENLHRRALAIRERNDGLESTSVAHSLGCLAAISIKTGRYGEAEAFLFRSLAIRRKVLPADDPWIATSLHNLATLYCRERHYQAAEPLLDQALAIRQKRFGPDHRLVAETLNNLGALYRGQGRQAEATAIYQRVLAIREKLLGHDHPSVADVADNLANALRAAGRDDDAEAGYRRALRIREQALGPDHPDVATSLEHLAQLYDAQARLTETEPLLDRAIAIRERAGTSPGDRADGYYMRALLGWKLQRRSEALADLRRAMDLAENQRVQSSGAEHERAELFAHFATMFERMVAWQVELGDVAAALDAIERIQARSLVDELSSSGVDLSTGRTAAEREQFQRQEERINGQIARLEVELARFAKEQRGETTAERRRQLVAELTTTREQLYQHYRNERSSNPVYRGLLGGGGSHPRLSQLQRELAEAGGLVLVYLLGREGGYVISLGSHDATLGRLAIDKASAAVLGVDAGPLTNARLSRALMNAEGSGVLQQLRNPARADEATGKLAALWEVLVPPNQRSALAAGKVRQLSVVPDGTLALVPFETLIVEPGEKPKYLLDVGPPIVYAPSTTVLINLRERNVTPVPAGREGVLSVGDPAYVDEASEPAAPRDGSLEPLGAARHDSGRGGPLARLPHSRVESQWLLDAFAKHGQPVAQLLGNDATESKVRSAAAGRRLVHLACHGLTEQAHGNFFGALALTAGKPSDGSPDDDGFLTLAEIYELKLTSCELAILSACDTNYGPQQEGEGVWALSRGFLVAGSRRVVASNWLVDDEATASLVSCFCDGLAKEQESAGSTDYAAALRAAKRWVRSQEAWHSPYFWGTFVLVGPN